MGSLIHSVPDPEFREVLRRGPQAAAQALLGCEIDIPGEGVSALITEVEAYGGPEQSAWPDPAAHCWPGPTARNAAMFGDAGHLYVYQSYGIHLCANVTAGTDGEGGGVLIRSIAILSGEDIVRQRRGLLVPFHQLGRGPGNVGQALGVTLNDYALDLLDADSRIQLGSGVGKHSVGKHSVGKQALAECAEPSAIRTGPRVGVRRASERPWRMWVSHPSVSAYRRHKNATGEF